MKTELTRLRNSRSELDKDLMSHYLLAEEAMLEAKLRYELGTGRMVAKQRKDKSIGEKLTGDTRIWRERIEAEKARFIELKRQADEAPSPI